MPPGEGGGPRLVTSVDGELLSACRDVRAHDLDLTAGAHDEVLEVAGSDWHQRARTKTRGLNGTVASGGEFPKMGPRLVTS